MLLFHEEFDTKCFHCIVPGLVVTVAVVVIVVVVVEKKAVRIVVIVVVEFTQLEYDHFEVDGLVAEYCLFAYRVNYLELLLQENLQFVFSTADESLSTQLF